MRTFINEGAVQGTEGDNGSQPVEICIVFWNTGKNVSEVGAWRFQDS